MRSAVLWQCKGNCCCHCRRHTLNVYLFGAFDFVNTSKIQHFLFCIHFNIYAQINVRIACTRKWRRQTSNNLCVNIFVFCNDIHIRTTYIVHRPCVVYRNDFCLIYFWMRKFVVFRIFFFSQSQSKQSREDFVSCERLIHVAHACVSFTHLHCSSRKKEEFDGCCQRACLFYT